MNKINKTLIFFVLLAFLLGVISSYLYFEREQNIDIKSQCYTDLQPGNYFSTKNYGGVSPIIINNINKCVEIEFLGRDELMIRQASSTGSMRPTIGDAGHVLIYKPKNGGELKVGDIITFDSGKEEYKEIMHRIIEIREINNTNYYTTKGDNNNIADKKLITFNDIKYKVVGVFY